MGFNLDSGWQLEPVGGNTGSAFMGIRAQEKVFLKRNASPFLAALSAEGITPKLIWTKRMSSGDVLTAQEWLNGRTLTAEEMQDKSVIALLNKVHHSALLKKMMSKMRNKKLTTQQYLAELLFNFPEELKMNPLIAEQIHFMATHQPKTGPEDVELCHGDLNHKNWLLSDDELLYLVDWENAIFADYALDLGTVLCLYIPIEHWNQWLEDYGITPTVALKQRLIWYGIGALLGSIRESFMRSRFAPMNRDILKLKQIKKEMTSFN